MFKYISKRIYLGFILTLFSVILIFSYTLTVVFIKNPYEIQLIAGNRCGEKEGFRRNYLGQYNAIPIITKSAIILPIYSKFQYGEIFDKSEHMNQFRNYFSNH